VAGWRAPKIADSAKSLTLPIIWGDGAYLHCHHALYRSSNVRARGWSDSISGLYQKGHATSTAVNGAGNCSVATEAWRYSRWAEPQASCVA